MKVTCRYEIPKEAYEHTNWDIGEHVGDMIVRELCKKITDIVANGGEYIFRMTPNEIMENTYANALQYQRYVLYEPLIRCKNCKHWYADADTGMACEFTNMGQPEDGYCNWGERKGGEDE